MSSRLLISTLLLFTGVNWAAAQSCCPATGCSAKPADLPQIITINCIEKCHGGYGAFPVGHIHITGNAHTAPGIILAQLPFVPGQVVTYPDLRAAEHNLQKLDIFEFDPDGTGIRPTVEVLSPDGSVPVKDILVTVHEKCGASFVCDIDDDEDDDETRSKCSCEDDCKCCGCKNKPGAECSCNDECKCCGCKTVDTFATSAACVSHVVVPDGGTVMLAGLNFCVTGDAAAEKCKCEGNCECCDCQKVVDDGCGADCSCAECKCCGCKAGYEAAKTFFGKCVIGDGCCPFCPHSLDACSMGWLMMEEVCPVLRLWSMCPTLEAKFQEVLKPCMKSFVRECKQIFKAGKANTCPAEQGGCEENGEPQAKKQKRGSCGHCATSCGQCSSSCGQCSSSCDKTARQRQHVWLFHACPVKEVKRAAGFVFAWKWANDKTDCNAKDEKSPCGAAKAAEPAKTTCPYLQKKEQVKEKAASACDVFEKMGTPLDNLAKLEKARHLCKKADWLCEQGHYDRAVKCYEKVKELCPGSRWEVTADEGIKLVQAMKAMDDSVRTVTRELMEKLMEEVINKARVHAVEESEPAQEEAPLPCREPEAVRQYKERFADLVEQARCACAAGDLDNARRLAQEAVNLPTPEVAEKVKALIDSARASFTAGCHAEGWEMLHQALMLDPESTEAQALQNEMLVDELHNRCGRFDCDRYQLIPPWDEDAESCEPFDPYEPYEPYEPSDPCDPCFDVPYCPGVGFKQQMPPVDARLINAMERILVELRHPYDLVVPFADGGCEEQEVCFVIDVDEEDLELAADECVPCDEAEEVDLRQQVRELMDMIREKICVDVDFGGPQTSRARLWVQIGNVEYFVTFDAQGQQFVRVRVSAPEAEDIKAAQQANIDETLQWIEAMNSGETAVEGDSEETEEPYYQLETDLDPDW